MTRNTIDAPQSAHGTDAETNLDHRTEILQSFIIANSITLTEAAHEAAKYKLFFTYPEAILAKLNGNLDRYAGPAEETAFLKWATRFVRKEAQRYEITGRILEEYEDVIHKAIHESLWTSAIDHSVEHQDIFWEVVYLIFEKAHAFDRKGNAKLSTRIYGLVERHCYLYHNSKNTRRRDLVRLRQNEIGVEHFSEEELAAMRADEADDGDGIATGYSDLKIMFA